MNENESFAEAMNSARNYADAQPFVPLGVGMMLKPILDRLQAAHDRELEQARDPQRLRGTKPETFDGAIEALREFRWQHATNDEDAIPYINAVKEMHDHEIRDVCQQQYHRGYEDGRHSMDAVHRAVAMRLRALPMNRVEHDANLHDIIEPVCGTNKAGDVDLRDELVRLMGGVSEPSVADVAKELMDTIIDEGNRKLASEPTINLREPTADLNHGIGEIPSITEVSDRTAEPMTTDEFIEYVEEDTRRLRGDATGAGDDSDTCACAGGGACDADCGRDSGEQEEVGDERLADDCGADTGCGGRGGDLHMDGLVAYDVLWDEQHEAVRKLRYLRERGANIWNREIVVAIGLGKQATNDDMCDRLIHLLGGDQPSGIDVLRAMDERDVEGGITDELRKFAMTYKNVWYDDSGSIIYTTSDFPPTEDAMSMMNHINEIADRIDVQFNWAMISRSSELGCCKLRINQLESERDDLQVKLDEYDRTHVELPRDANGNVIFTRHSVRKAGNDRQTPMTVYSLILTFKGWNVYASSDSYAVEREPSFFEVCDDQPETVESVIEKLTLGEITQTEAIEHIKSLGQE